MDLMEKQDALQKEAHGVLEKLQLIKILSKYGKPEIVGSLALGLMTWRDIDIEVIVDNLNREIVSEFVADIVKIKLRKINLNVTDNRNQNSPKTPSGIYVGINYYDHLPIEEQSSHNPNLWKIDIHFILSENAKGSEKAKQINKQLTDEKRKIILEIKNVLMNSPEHRKTIFSVDIYDAVFEKGVKNLEEFKDYLKESSREL